MNPPHSRIALAFGTPRKLPKPRALEGRVVVLDVAFAGVDGGGFDKITRPFIEGLGERLAAWVDHHDHALHAEYSKDARFVLATKAEHGACPEMITPELVARVGAVDTIVCHTDFDGLASAAKWMRGGQEPYPGCDRDAFAIDTRIGEPSALASRFDRALRARPRDQGLFGLVVRHLASGLADKSLWEPIDAAAAELIPIEQETRRAAQSYRRYAPGVAIVDVVTGYRALDKTLLLLLGQEREPVSVVLDAHSVSIAAAYDSGYNFLELLGLQGGMPTRISVPRNELPRVLKALGVDPTVGAEFE
ncbi:MAG: hypothetical protein KIT72_06100 [Polyangiaceae bacterium]|nr:hypothetical protein [Polyangiaceae bacterium]MCW5789972.1 hypothetical protein [Polyangiaceae bacterium]